MKLHLKDLDTPVAPCDLPTTPDWPPEQVESVEGAQISGNSVSGDQLLAPAVTEEAPQELPNKEEVPEPSCLRTEDPLDEDMQPDTPQELVESVPEPVSFKVTMKDQKQVLNDRPISTHNVDLVGNSRYLGDMWVDV